MSTVATTVGFGAPATHGAHTFRVEVPASRTEPVVIVEDYGYAGGLDGRPLEVSRVRVRRPIWTIIAEVARQHFNERLKAKGHSTSRWTVGTTLVERHLGRELCVLAWAAESANEVQAQIIGNNWQAFRPEERWWLFMETVGHAGGIDDAHRGWRRALFYALSDGERPPAKSKAWRPRESDQISLVLEPDPE